MGLAAILPPDFAPMETHRPLSAECVEGAAAIHQVPVTVLYALLRKEDGRVGEVAGNRNGSYDHGPMQVNTVWLRDLQAQGISQAALVHDGCANVYAGAAVLADMRRAADGKIWKAVGFYHTGANPEWTTERLDRYVDYLSSVIEWVTKPQDFTRVIASANEAPRNGGRTVAANEDGRAPNLPAQATGGKSSTRTPATPGVVKVRRMDEPAAIAEAADGSGADTVMIRIVGGG